MHHHLSLGDVVASHWSDIETFAFAVILLGIARLCFRG
jgi:hypothetical protein